MIGLKHVKREAAHAETGDEEYHEVSDVLERLTHQLSVEGSAFEETQPVEYLRPDEEDGQGSYRALVLLQHAFNF